MLLRMTTSRERVGVRIEEELLDRIDRLARQSRRTRSDMIRFLLWAATDAVEPEPPVAHGQSFSELDSVIDEAFALELAGDEARRVAVYNRLESQQ
jgi:hypothetical protein